MQDRRVSDPHFKFWRRAFYQLNYVPKQKSPEKPGDLIF